MIDGVLKEEMIIKAQRLQVTCKKQDKQYVVGIFQEIGRAWKQLPFELLRAALLNQTCNGVFNKDKGYEFYMETDVMKELKLDCDGVKGKGDIAKMTTRRQAESAKNINCTTSQTHGFKLQKSG